MNCHEKIKRIPYQMIVRATNGDPDAIDYVIRYYGSYINTLSVERYIDQQGKIYCCVNDTTKQRLIDIISLFE